jgi:carotenoid cleavage dioxygenase-like enzyme
MTNTIKGALFPESVLTVTQQELSETEMSIVEGTLPDDLSGHVFMLAPVGHLDSPRDKVNANVLRPSDDGTPMFNGNAMIYRFDFDKPFKVGLKSKIARTPCYYADEATKKGSKYQEYGFHNFGVARLSPSLGVRSVANTAIVPMKFAGENERLILTCDVGRPYEIDTDSLDVITPIGANKEWREQLTLDLPFKMVMNTAHPFFDAQKNEMFTVNYGKSLSTTLSPILRLEIEKLPEVVKETFKNFAQKLQQDTQKIKSLEIIKDLHEILERLNKEIHEVPEVIKNLSRELQKLIKSVTPENALHLLEDLKQLVNDGVHLLEGLIRDDNDFVELIRWNGKSDFEKWSVTLADGSPIKIKQTIHQMAVTQDYVVLMDTGFKVGPEQLITKPIIKNKSLEDAIRKLLDYPTLSETHLYIVRRADLKAEQCKVVAQHVTISGGVIHFEVDYDNPQNQITLHVAHSGAWDVSEWLRDYDTHKWLGEDYDTKPGHNLHRPVGMVSGAGDIHPLGRYVIDVEKGTVVESKIVSSEELTWAIAINAYNKQAASKKFDSIYWNAWGCWGDLLSDFSGELYEDYHGQYSLRQVQEITQEGRPASIFRLVTDSCDSMAIADCYKFPPGYFGNSPQFIPRTNSDGSSTDGYILCSVLYENNNEIWIFDAKNLAHGALCKLSHPGMDFGFTTHTCWLPKIAPRTASYYIAAREDHEDLVKKQPDRVQKLFEEEVYPKFSPSDSINITSKSSLTGYPPVPMDITDAARDELSNLKLNILESKLPDNKLPEGLHGHVFIMGPVGSVDSDGLPYCKGDPIFNSDGMVYRLDFDQNGEVNLKTKILKAPCYYADEATQHEAKYKFNNLGISRLSLQLGSRNQLNTAFVPFSTGEEPIRLLATSDAGRPYEIDTETLDVVTPVGSNKEWCPEIPINFPFPIVLSTAHPSFDPCTHEMFTVNYGRGLHNFLDTIPYIHDLDIAEEKVINFVHSVFKPFSDVYGQIHHSVRTLISKLVSPLLKDFVYLIRWDGVSDLERWRLVLEDETPVKIEQSLHEIGITKDYVVLMDTDFKVGISDAYNNPFPNYSKLEGLVKNLVTRPVLPDATVYIVRRKDLKCGQKPKRDRKETKVVARKLTLPQAGIHFVLDYDNPDNKITLYVAHNCADTDEWVRPYDLLASNSKPVSCKLRGMLTTAFDVSRLGRYLIDGESGEILESKVVSDPRKTWGLGLYTYHESLPTNKPPKKVENIYWQASGFWQDLLTKSVFDMYKDYKYRVVPAEQLLENPSNPQSKPSCLLRLDTKSMEIADSYEFPLVSKDGKQWDSHIICSPQFVPRANGDGSSTDGYIVCTVLSDKSEIWIFDAQNLAQGALCKLGHPSLNFAYTLHTTWLPKIAQHKASYNCSVREDYQDLVKKKSKEIQKLFEDKVYPPFEKDKAITAKQKQQEKILIM